MREQQRILQQQPNAAVMRGNLDVRRGVGEHPIPDPHGAAVGPDQPGEHVQHGRLTRAVRSEDGQDLTGRDVEFDVYVPTFDDGTQRHAGHDELQALAPRSRRLPSPSTTTAATATNNSESATAASASVSRCR